jgi:hypothetical protein
VVSLRDDGLINVDDGLPLVHQVNELGSCKLSLQLVHDGVVVVADGSDDLVAETQLELQEPPDH